MNALHLYSAAFGNIKRFSLDFIFKIVCEEVGVNQTAVKRGAGKRELSNARKLFCKYARMFTRESYPHIGEYIGKNHATAIYLERQCNAHISTEPEFKEFHQKIMYKFNN